MPLPNAVRVGCASQVTSERLCTAPRCHFLQLEVTAAQGLGGRKSTASGGMSPRACRAAGRGVQKQFSEANLSLANVFFTAGSKAS